MTESTYGRYGYGPVCESLGGFAATGRIRDGLASIRSTRTRVKNSAAAQSYQILPNLKCGYVKRDVRHYFWTHDFNCLCAISTMSLLEPKPMARDSVMGLGCPAAAFKHDLDYSWHKTDAARLSPVFDGRNLSNGCTRPFWLAENQANGTLTGRMVSKTAVDRPFRSTGRTDGSPIHSTLDVAAGKSGYCATLYPDVPTSARVCSSHRVTEICTAAAPQNRRDRISYSVSAAFSRRKVHKVEKESKERVGQTTESEIALGSTLSTNAECERNDGEYVHESLTSHSEDNLGPADEGSTRVEKVWEAISSWERDGDYGKKLTVLVKWLEILREEYYLSEKKKDGDLTVCGVEVAAGRVDVNVVEERRNDDGVGKGDDDTNRSGVQGMKTKMSPGRTYFAHSSLRSSTAAPLSGLAWTVLPRGRPEMEARRVRFEVLACPFEYGQ
ncbi:hypothetical protein B0H19DRAFT_1086144 [Mycena capillaripes]|nr:hypothetical protein B0H19DRAFT_1086144 [Mycena capillaripes]